MNRLEELRKAKKLTQSKLAKMLDIAPNTLSQYENGKRQIPDGIKIKLADFYNVSVDYLLGWPTLTPILSDPEKTEQNILSERERQEFRAEIARLRLDEYKELSSEDQELMAEQFNNLLDRLKKK